MIASAWKSHIAATIALIAIACALSPASVYAQTDVAYDSLNVDGAWIVYRVAGAVEPLVLLHGFTGSGRVWDDVGLLDAFASQYRVIAPDLRGRGRSIDPAGDLGPAASARDVFALLDHLGVRSTRALGVSFGSLVLLHMATAQPDRLDAIVLVSGGHYLPQATREGIRREADPAAVPPQALEAMASRHGHIGGLGQVRPDPRSVSFRTLQLRRYQLHTAISVHDLQPHVDRAWRPRCVVASGAARRDASFDTELIAVDPAGTWA